MIKKIFHLADIHIPNSDMNRPYSNMLKLALAEILKKAKTYEKDEVRFVLAGDIFHNKIKITNEALSTFHTLLNYLNAMGKTIIIAGNHDMLENNHDRLDSLTPTFDIKGAYPNITYLDKALDYKSGYVIDDNVIWVLYSMFDKFSGVDVELLRNKYPDHKIIGLYHGDITGATTELGRVCENGLDTNKFNGCDCVMAGHIHKHQEIKKGTTPIVYAGSLFQQNSGENTTKHGYVLWDVDKLKYKHYDVSNNYKIYKFKIHSYEDVEQDTERLINI